jgi:hypothetical protein
MAPKVSSTEHETVIAYSSYVEAYVHLAREIGADLQNAPRPIPDDVAEPYRNTASHLVTLLQGWAPPLACIPLEAAAVSAFSALAAAIEAAADELHVDPSQATATLGAHLDRAQALALELRGQGRNR